LTPILEKSVREARGKVKLVKLNIDDHPAIPGQMGIQSIPAVIAFVNGQPADGFMGAVPESQVKQFIDRIAGANGGGSEAEAVEAALSQAKAALGAGDLNAAAGLFQAVLQHDPENAKASAGMAECLLAAGQTHRAKELLAGLSDEQRKDADVASVLARMAQAEEVAKLGDPNALEARLAANPDDHAARLDLAKILNVKGERDAAADHLLTIMRKDRSWEDDGARRTLLDFFEAWGPTDPATLAARRKLSSILFS
jgi:putative thioredoxin